MQTNFVFLTTVEDFIDIIIRKSVNVIVSVCYTRSSIFFRYLAKDFLGIPNLSEAIR